MHILLAIIGLVSAIGVWYWRLRMAGRIARGVGEVAQTAANLPRRLSFLSKARQGGIRVISDPREAAAVMMVQIAEAHGVVTERHMEAMQDAIGELFEFNAAESEALIAHAGWIGRSGPASHAIMSRMAGVVVRAEAIGPKELVDLDAVLVSVTEAMGEPSPEQLKLLQIYRDKAGIAA
ncbi:MAG: hypothetical protein AAFX03_02780 [Pseudomonadota bacterium]